MSPIFRPGPGPYALALAMTGVQLGERLLQIGAGTPGMFAALAAKVGLSGRAAGVTESETATAGLENAGTQAGVLVEVQTIVSGSRLPYDNDAFDLVVIDSTTEAADKSRSWLGEALRVLRAGGRLIVVERYAAGLRALVVGGRPPSGPTSAAASDMLQAHGFRPVRKIAERDGWRFTEGMKPKA